MLRIFGDMFGPKSLVGNPPGAALVSVTKPIPFRQLSRYRISWRWRHACYNKTLITSDCMNRAFHGSPHPGRKRELFLTQLMATKTGNDTLKQPGRKPQRLLLGIDLYHNEKASIEMCDWVLQQVYRPGDCIILIHCIVPLPMMDVYSLPDGRLVSNASLLDMMKMQDAIEEEMNCKLEVFQDRIKRSYPGITVEARVFNQKTMYTTLSASLSEKKKIADMICDAVVDMQADALFLASSARGGVAEIFEGSVAASTVRKANVPVVVYRAAKMRQALMRSSQHSLFEEKVVKWLEKIGNIYSDIISRKASETEATAVSAAAGPLYGHITIGQPDIVSSGDLDDDPNLIGQTICEIPGLDAVDEDFKAAIDETNASHSDSQRVFLVPVECNSDVSMHAVEWISDTLYRPGDTLVLLHIIPSIPFMIPSMPSMGIAASTLVVADSITLEYEESCKKLMAEKFVPYLQQRGVDYKLEILVELSDGSTEGLGEAIINRAKEWDAIAIAIGSHSRGGIGEFLMGSVANYVDHHSPMPVIVIH